MTEERRFEATIKLPDGSTHKECLKVVNYSPKHERAARVNFLMLHKYPEGTQIIELKPTDGGKEHHIDLPYTRPEKLPPHEVPVPAKATIAAPAPIV